MVDFKGKTVLVTGGSRGLGRAVAFEYARAGAQLVLLDILDEELSATAAELRKAGHTAYAFQCDLTSNEGVASLGAQIIKDIGVPDIVHNNAMWAGWSAIEDIDIGGINRAFDVNVLGYLRVIKAFVNGMIERGSGWIVNTASPNGIVPIGDAAALGIPYNLCKAADISISQGLAAGLKKYGIGVTVLYPGVTKTGAFEGLRQSGPKELVDATEKMFLEHGAEAEDAARELISGVREGKFMVSTFPSFDRLLVQFAKNGLNPNADYSQIPYTIGGFTAGE